MNERAYYADDELMHYARGQRAQKHKYIAIKNGKYIYPEDNINYNDRLTTAKKRYEYLEGGHARRLTNGDYTNMLDRRFRNREDVKKGGMGRPLYKRYNPDTGRPELVREDKYNKYNEVGLRADYINPNSRRDTNFGGDTHHSDIVRPRLKKTETKLKTRLDEVGSGTDSMIDRLISEGTVTKDQGRKMKEDAKAYRKKVYDQEMKRVGNKYHSSAVKGAIIGRKISEAPNKAYKSVLKSAKDAYRVGSNLKTRAAKEVKNATTSASKTYNSASKQVSRTAKNVSKSASKTYSNLRDRAEDAYDDVRSGARNASRSASKTYNNLRKDVSSTAKNASKAVSGAYKDTTSSLEKSYKSTKKKANKAKKNATKTLRGYASKGKNTINRIIN